jgi:translation initiation factor IF-3
LRGSYKKAYPKKLRINYRIRMPQLRLIGEDGKQLGIVSRNEALKMAREAGLDLVEVSPHTRPPVCKIMDYGKHMYEERKKEKKRKHSIVKLKELKLGLKIDEHDYNVKLRKAKEFLSNGNKVKVRLKFRGREVIYADRGKDVLMRFARDLEEISNIEQSPTREGRFMIFLLSPKQGTKQHTQDKEYAKNKDE